MTAAQITFAERAKPRVSTNLTSNPNSPNNGYLLAAGVLILLYFALA